MPASMAAFIETRLPRPGSRYSDTMPLQPQTAWRVTGLDYRLDSDTAPIPEPATLLLVGVGLAGVARRRFPANVTVGTAPTLALIC